MKKFTDEIFGYLKEERIGVLAVEMLDGSPHGATVHFSFKENIFQFFFETYKEYRKAESLHKNGKTRATFVVGSDEGNMKTLQIDGEIRLLTEEEIKIFEDNYFGRFPEKLEKYEQGKYVCFTFVPTWWRFTDWTNPEGKKILSSEN